MPSAFHTFKLVPAMAQNASARQSQISTPQPAPILPPSTPANSRPSPNMSSSTQPQIQTPTMATPSSESRMHPPSIPRSLMTPARELRESSVASSIGGGSATRKPRQNLDERDQIQALKACIAQKHNFKEGTKSQFWNGVNAQFHESTGKVLAQMSATVARLVEARRRQVCDWENEVIPEKPGGELNTLLDEWIEFLKVEDADAENERQRQVDARRRVEESRKEARKQVIAQENLMQNQSPGVRIVAGPAPPQPVADMGQNQPQHPPTGQELVYQSAPNGEFSDANGFRPHKRRRTTNNEHHLPPQVHQEPIVHYGQDYRLPSLPPSEPPRRVVVEGQLTKEDWRDIMGNDARLRVLENKVDKIEMIVSQNNKLLLQLLANQKTDDKDKERERDKRIDSEDHDRVPVHLDAEFERDYLTGRYSKTPLPIND
ncbi:401b09a3-07b6-48e4-9d82-0c3bf5169d3f [Sclerotinia trifoliorum]|uniref:401b09a3-07b6-48e4-9d82-0c3bf5169d3f n=1 Tax=Sclerotinia trifoliorum TaxID=28548 RepID=A0A8H2VU66_9HELO|nr:401b09a3-07b6-48e4-9d82-0c3bf5169d3f [Sclerotinia trifoliorum]